jgi:hypothetical protein
MNYAAIILLAATSLWLSESPAAGQSSTKEEAPLPAPLAESGQIMVAGRSTPYLIHRLPVSSFPDLPDTVAEELGVRGCMIPQTYQAHRPENVVHASLEKSGSLDWAVLCSTRGTVRLLVFFASSPEKPTELASVSETESLQAHDRSGVLGFSWGIDPASPQRVREAQAAMEHHPPLLDHDALADTNLEKGTVYHFYSKNRWTLVEMPQP